MAYTTPYTNNNTTVLTSDYIIVLTFVNTFVIAVVNTVVITIVGTVVMAAVWWKMGGDFLLFPEYTYKIAVLLGKDLHK